MEKKNLKAPKKLYIEKNPIPSHKYALLASKPIKTEDKINLIQEVNFLSRSVIVKSKSAKRIKEKDKLSKDRPVTQESSVTEISAIDETKLDHNEISENITIDTNEDQTKLLSTIDSQLIKELEQSQGKVTTSIFEVESLNENPEIRATKNTKKKSKSKVKK